LQEMSASNLTHSQREQLRALQARMADVRDLVCDAIRQRDFAAMECGFDVYREFLNERRALVTGEPSEPVMGEAREYGVHFLAGGHYATETFGIRRLGELIAERFEIDQEFIDVPNPV